MRIRTGQGIGSLTIEDVAAQSANSRIASKFCANDVPSSVENGRRFGGSSFNGSCTSGQ
jgi:hypothetical protein